MQGSEDLGMDVDLKEVIEEITGSKILGAIARMKRGKATGDDDLHVEIVKEDGEEAQKLLLAIMQNAYRQETVPAEWQRGVINPIFKKIDKCWVCRYLPDEDINYIVLVELVEGLEDPVLSRPSPELGVGKRQIFCLFIDMEKAFDRVPRKLIWKIMSEPPYSAPRKLIRVIKNIYSNSVSKVREGDLVTDWFDIKAGVRQGDGLSPLLFILFMDKCIRETIHNQISKFLPMRTMWQ